MEPSHALLSGTGGQERVVFAPIEDSVQRRALEQGRDHAQLGCGAAEQGCAVEHHAPAALLCKVPGVARQAIGDVDAGIGAPHQPAPLLDPRQRPPKGLEAPPRRGRATRAFEQLRPGLQ